jgi:hypothetical protein
VKETPELKILPKKEASFLTVIGPEHGYGPFQLSWNKVSLQLIVVLEEAISMAKKELLMMVQEGEYDKEGEGQE